MGWSWLPLACFSAYSEWKAVMPPPCNRCRQCPPSEGDSWCLACTGWEALGRDLAGTWDSVGCRAVASDLVVSCVRQVRALRNLGAGISRASSRGGGTGSLQSLPAGPGPAGSAVPAATPKSAGATPRESLPRRRSRTEAPPPPRVKSEESERGEVEEESEEEEIEEERQDEEIPDITHRSLGGGERRPPEPEGSPPRRDRSRRPPADRSRAGSRERRHGRHQGDRERDRTRSKRKRAGRKHQRLYRLAEDPNLRVHRKPAEDFWTLGVASQGRQALDRLWEQWLLFNQERK